MKKESKHDVVIDLTNSPDQSEVVFEDRRPNIVWNKFSARNELPVNWEDLLYDAWRENHLKYTTMK